MPTSLVPATALRQTTASASTSRWEAEYASFTVPSHLPRTLAPRAPPRTPALRRRPRCSRRSGTGRAARPTRGSFAGLGTWIDIYDAPAYRSPGPTAAKIAARGVQDRLRRDRERPQHHRRRQPEGARALRRRAKARGIRVVAWYLPGSSSRRSTCAAHARCCPSGRRAGARSTASRSTSRRCASRAPASARARLLALSRILRSGGGRHPDRGDHLSVTRLRAPSDLVAGLPLAAGDARSSTPGSR